VRLSLAVLLLGACASQSPTLTSTEDRLREIVDAWIGTPYRYQGSSLRGTDCSGFTRTVMLELGVDLPRRSSDQARVGEPVERDALRTGDLLFFDLRRNGRGIDHVGLYLGEGVFAHASRRRGVALDRLDLDTYQRGYRGARRVLMD
jgi:cell wall-associated NlpC family hydrolase